MPALLAEYAQTPGASWNAAAEDINVRDFENCPGPFVPGVFGSFCFRYARAMRVKYRQPFKLMSIRRTRIFGAYS